MSRVLARTNLVTRLPMNCNVIRNCLDKKLKNFFQFLFLNLLLEDSVSLEPLFTQLTSNNPTNTPLHSSLRCNY